LGARYLETNQLISTFYILTPIAEFKTSPTKAPQMAIPKSCPCPSRLHPVLAFALGGEVGVAASVGDGPSPCGLLRSQDLKHETQSLNISQEFSHYRITESYSLYILIHFCTSRFYVRGFYHDMTAASAGFSAVLELLDLAKHLKTQVGTPRFHPVVNFP